MGVSASRRKQPTINKQINPNSDPDVVRATVLGVGGVGKSVRGSPPLASHLTLAGVTVDLLGTLCSPITLVLSSRVLLSSSHLHPLPSVLPHHCSLSPTAIFKG